MKPYKTRMELAIQKPGLYKQLIEKRPEILSKFFPSRTERAKIKLEQECYSLGKYPIRGTANRSIHQRYFNKSLDSAWAVEMRKKYPWLATKSEQGFKRMLQKMPETVSFVKGQKWKGTNSKYYFLCAKFGKFKGKASKLMCTSWRVGLSGHPRASRLSSELKKLKPVVNVDTGEVFNSSKAVKERYGVSIAGCLRGVQKTSLGYKWAYHDAK